jgi:uncharacterized protein YjbJ (UPF0337 family)
MPTEVRTHVDKERIKGKGNEVKGEVRQAYGRAVGDDQQVAKGEAEEARGKTQGVIGKAKDAARDVGDAAKGAVGAVKDAVDGADKDDAPPAR